MRYALHFAARKFPVAKANLWSVGFLGERPLHNFGGCGDIGSRVSLFGVGLSTFLSRLGRMNAVVVETGTHAPGCSFLGLSRRVRACCQCRSAVAGVRQSSSASDARPQFSPISCSAASAHRIGALIAAALVGPMSGIYATQAMESRQGAIDAPPGSAAETVVDRLAAQAVLSFRERHGLIADSDFAYAFSSWEEAAQNSGHAVADAWAEVSQDLEDAAILGLVDRAVAAGQAERASVPAPVRISHLVRKPVAERAGRSRRRDLPALSGAADGELCEFLVDSGARQPDNLQGERRKEWVSFLKVLAAKKVAAAEPATVTRALRTLRELSQWQVLRGRSGGLGDVDSIDLFAFLRDGTQAPARALSGLRWFVKLAGLGWDLSDLQPAPKLGREGPSQAAVAEPGMVEELEHRIVQLYEASDPRWSCLLANWLIMAGCLRHQHLERSYPVSITQSTAHFWCSKGKQSHSRAGFRWAAPAHFTEGFPWAEAWLESYGSLPASQRQRCGICFDSAGHPWQFRQVTLLAQEVFSGLEPPVSTYSWRRVAPSVGTLMGLDDTSLLALGDWTDKSKVQSSKASMPIHYSGTRYSLSVRVKHLTLAATARCLALDSWAEAQVQATDPSLQAEVAEKIRLDGTTIWRPPAGTPGPPAKLTFKTTALKLRRQSRESQLVPGGTRSKPAEPKMPAQVNGRVCSAFLRNGMRLCPAFQSASCRADQCALAHQCATVLRSGRVCGGRHPARECHDRRRIAPGDVPPAVSVPTGVAEEPVRPPLPRKPQLPVTEPRVAPAARPKAAGPRASTGLVEVEVEALVAAEPVAMRPKPKRRPRVSGDLPVQAGAPVRLTPRAASLDVVPAQPERRVRASSWRDRQPRDEPASSSQAGRPLRPGEWRDKPASSRAPVEPLRRGKKRGHEDDEARFDELARTAPKKGDRQALQIPTEVWRSRAGGRLFLGALPTEANKDKFPPVALQITAMAQHPWSRGGVVLPGALHRQWQITVWKPP